MPELPEVETIAKQLLQEKIIGKAIREVEILHTQVLEGGTAQDFHRLEGQKFQKIGRRGKYLVFELSQDTILVHLRMTGKVFFVPPSEKHLKHVHIKLHLDDGRIIHYEDPRRFGRWFIGNEVQNKLSQLGVEPLSKDFTLELFQKLLQTHSVKIKPFLLNQKYIVGLGNIYVDEALWEAEIHPKTSTEVISKPKTKSLFEAIRKVLKKGIANQGTTLGKFASNYLSVKGSRGDNQEDLNVFRREGQLCPRCKGVIVKTVVAQRGTHYCPVCQKYK